MKNEFPSKSILNCLNKDKQKRLSYVSFVMLVIVT